MQRLQWEFFFFFSFSPVDCSTIHWYHLRFLPLNFKFIKKKEMSCLLSSNRIFCTGWLVWVLFVFSPQIFFSQSKVVTCTVCCSCYIATDQIRFFFFHQRRILLRFLLFSVFNSIAIIQRFMLLSIPINIGVFCTTTSIIFHSLMCFLLVVL